MKKTFLIGLIAGIAGLAIGYKVPKDKNAGYVMISGRITKKLKEYDLMSEVDDQRFHHFRSTVNNINFNFHPLLFRHTL